LNLVAGLDQPDAGTIRLDDQVVVAPGPDRAVIFQDGALFPWLDVGDNVAFGLKQQGVPRAERAERANAMLARLGLGGLERRNLHELSGGMRQRVAIARALVLDPRLILMDEPFSALDAITREELYALLQALWQPRGPTVILVTHNVREAVVLGDRIVLMSPNPGKIEQVYDVHMEHPRHIDDADVARLAKRISGDMRFGVAPPDLGAIHI
jgi:NitT/TauT family transport system ATP-binding protein